jgi:hypothetical protein
MESMHFQRFSSLASQCDAVLRRATITFDEDVYPILNSFRQYAVELPQQPSEAIVQQARLVSAATAKILGLFCETDHVREATDIFLSKMIASIELARKSSFLQGIELDALKLCSVFFRVVEMAPMKTEEPIKGVAGLTLVLRHLALIAPSQEGLEVYWRCVIILLRLMPTLDASHLPCMASDLHDVSASWSDNPEAVAALLQVWERALAEVFEKGMSRTLTADLIDRYLMLLCTVCGPFMDQPLTHASSIKSLHRLSDTIDALAKKCQGSVVSYQKFLTTFRKIDVFPSVVSRGVPTFMPDRLNRWQPGKAPVAEVKRLERFLLFEERLSTLVQRYAVLMSLELIGVGFQRLCFKQNMRWERHPDGQIPTLKPGEDGRTALHLLMEESMGSENLDVACVAHCSAQATEEQKRWILCTGVLYLRKFIEQQKALVHEAFQGLAACGVGTISLSDPEGLRPAAKGEWNSDDLHIPPLDSIYTNEAMVRYARLCEAEEDIPQIDEERFKILTAASNFLLSTFIAMKAEADLFGKRNAWCWQHYAAAVELVQQHTAKMKGYAYVDRLKASLEVRDTIILVSQPLDCAQEARLSSLYMPRLIDGLLRGGEAEFARAVCEVLSSNNGWFVDQFLNSHDLGASKEESAGIDAELEQHHEAPQLAQEEEEVVQVVARHVGVQGAKHRSAQTKMRGRKQVQRIPGSTHPKPHASDGAEAACASWVTHAQEEQDVGRALSSVEPCLTVDSQELSCSQGTGDLREIAQEALPYSGSEKHEALAQSEGSDSEWRETALVAECAIQQVQRPATSTPVRALTVPGVKTMVANALLDVVESCLKEKIGIIDRRIHLWKTGWYATRSEDDFDFHTVPLNLIPLVRAFGIKYPWQSKEGSIDECFYCPGEIKRFGKKKPPVSGYHAEAFSGENGKLYHHYFHLRTINDLIKNYELHGSLFGQLRVIQRMCADEFQKMLYQRLRATGSLFDPMHPLAERNCCQGRFCVQVAETTLRLIDRHTSTAYTMAVRVCSIPSQPNS